MENDNYDTNSYTFQKQGLNLREILLRRKINLSKNGWNRLHLNDKWHDEIYKREYPFVKYSIFEPLINVPLNKINVPLSINKNYEISLKMKVALSILNLGLIVSYFMS
jgi:hypothetical protein